METKEISTEVNLLEEIKRKGFLHIPFPHKINPEALSVILGNIFQVTDINFDKKNSRLLKSSREMDLHTDHQGARFVAWQCLSQAALGGESVLADAGALISSLTEEEISCLEKIMVISHPVQVNDSFTFPFLKRHGDKYQVFYSPWLLMELRSSKEESAMNKFKKLLQAIPKIEVKLSEGDWLIVDNYRMLHGRKQFDEKAGRLLKRYWFTGCPKS